MLVKKTTITNSVEYQKNEFDNDTIDDTVDDYVYVVPILNDYVDYYYSLETQENQQKYNDSKDYRRGFIEAIRLIFASGYLDDLDETDTTFQEFLQDRYGN